VRRSLIANVWLASQLGLDTRPRSKDRNRLASGRDQNLFEAHGMHCQNTSPQRDPSGRSLVAERLDRIEPIGIGQPAASEMALENAVPVFLILTTSAGTRMISRMRYGRKLPTLASFLGK
jgi:hypothetical protein